ncbi:MAG: HAMP domain-containing sensor histidine kinase, partial [Pseudomonadota bacterium]
MAFRSSLFTKLTLALFCLVGILCCVLMVIWQHTTERYSNEVTQRLNASIAMYVTDSHQLIKQGVVNQSELEKLANRAMIINPSVEIYLLNADGVIITDLVPREQLKQTRISLSRIRSFLNQTAPFPIYAENPKQLDSHKIFSVSPITENKQTVGYLYAILGGTTHDSIVSTIKGSYSLTFGLVALLGSLLMTLCMAGFIFYAFTRKLRRLTHTVQAFQLNDDKAMNSHINIGNTTNQSIFDFHEVNQLSNSFRSMADKIQRQFQQLGYTDKTRRELIANVSHDLRTPLASLQGYLETLSLRDMELTPEQHKQYLNIALKQSHSLSNLIDQLFDLSKLDAGVVNLSLEEFSLTEIIYDSIQDNQLMAAERNVTISFSESDHHDVTADISLIQRVIQNLISNAIKHSHADGTIFLSIERPTDTTHVSI